VGRSKFRYSDIGLAVGVLLAASAPSLSKILMEQTFSSLSGIDEEEYLKYLMFLSEAVRDTSAQPDLTTAVPRLSSLITSARDTTLRPYYCRTHRWTGGKDRKGVLPPIAEERKTSVKLPALRKDLLCPI